jgi:energy-coupling factor transporter ATP-binding protein EcfA2
MFDFRSLWANDVNWNSVSNTTKKIKKFGRQNLIAVAALCAIGGSLSAIVGLAGNYSPRASYCDTRTKPCTKVEVGTLTEIPMRAKDLKFIRGTGLQRTASSVVALLLFGLGVVAIAKAQEEQEEIEPQLQADRQVALARIELEATEELENLANLSQISVETHKQELLEAQAELMLERNPHLVDQYAPKAIEPTKLPETVEQKVIDPEPEAVAEAEPETEPLFFDVKLPPPPALGVQFWDWEWFNSRADEMPHIRVIGPTGSGKTTITDWLADVVPFDQRLVITVKRKPHQWMGLPVYGVPENYTIIRDKLEWLQTERIERTALMEKGIYRGRLSAIVDEWKAIARNVKAVKDPETKEIVSPSAKEIMGEQLTLSRESLIRIFAMAQGRQVITWGLEGESDILECFATVYLGQFAVEEAEAMQRKFARDSEEWAAWGKVIEFLRSLGKRAAWVECEFGKFPAIGPDLSKWKRTEISPIEDSKDIKTEIVNSPESIVHSPAPDDDPLPPELLKVAVERLEQSLSLPLPQDEDSQLSAVIADIAQQLSPLPSKDSTFEWTATKVSEFYPNHTRESLFGEISAALKTGAKVRDVITNILKCKGGRTHKTRSYTVHGKTLMIWLLTNYGDEGLLQLPKVKKFLEEELGAK